MGIYTHTYTHTHTHTQRGREIQGSKADQRKRETQEIYQESEAHVRRCLENDGET